MGAATHIYSLATRERKISSTHVSYGQALIRLSHIVSKIRVISHSFSGYVGGTVFSSIIDHPERASFTYTALVRSPEKAENLKDLGYNVDVVLGLTSDADLLTKLAADADIVIDMVDSDSVDPVMAVLSRLKIRHEKTGTVPSFIHTVTCFLLNKIGAMGMYASDTIRSDLDGIYINTLPETVIYKNVDSKNFNADIEGYVRTYIIMPPFVFGPTPGKLNDAGIQNPDMTCVMWVMGQDGFGMRWTKGYWRRHFWGFVSNTDVSNLFLLLFDRIKTNPENVPHGREGYYFATGGEFIMHEYVSAIGEIMAKHGQVEHSKPQLFNEETDRYFSVLGGNSQGRADRVKSIGWKPTAT